jgi:pSer/pThr/pTyr-binding forkhead associated (FHA) protein
MASSKGFMLLVQDRFGNLVSEHSFSAGQVTIGRAKDCDIVLPGENVSRRHATLFVVSGQVFLEDNKSANGTFLNGEPVVQRTVVPEGATIKIGDFTLHFSSMSHPWRDTKTFLRLVGKNLAYKGQAFDLNKQMVLVGRGVDAGFVIVDPSVSRIHARIICRPNSQPLVEDLRSANGTFVNGTRIKVKELQPGDTVRFGNVEFEVELPTATTARGKAVGTKIRWMVHRKWVLLSLLVAVALGVVVVMVAFLGSEPSQQGAPLGFGQPDARVADIVTTEPKPEKTVPSLLEEARALLKAGDLAKAEEVLDKAIKEDPLDAEAMRLKNLLRKEKEAKAKWDSAAVARDLSEKCGLLLEIPRESYLAGESERLLRELLPEIGKAQAMECRKKSSPECARLKGLVEKVKARVGR